MALLNDVFEAMKVEETLVSATALRGTEDPDTILLCENWIDRENLSVQLKRRYRDRYEARLPELLRSPPQTCPSSSRSAPSHTRCGKRRSSIYGHGPSQADSDPTPAAPRDIPSTSGSLLPATAAPSFRRLRP